MDQYRPAYKAFEYRELDRRITALEYKEIVDYAFSKGIKKRV